MQSVHRELGLSPEQQMRLNGLVRDLLAARSAAMARRAQYAQEGSAADVDTITATEERIVQQELSKLLSKDQASRLKQLTIQSQGINALATSSVAAELELTAPQKDRIQHIREEYYVFKNQQRQWTQVFGGAAATLQTRIAAGEQEFQRRVDAMLTREQRTKYQEMRGEEFDGFVVLPRLRQ
jgi:hypothetical protein